MQNNGLYAFLCPRLPLAGAGHIAFCSDVTCVCHVRNQVQVYLQVKVQIYVRS